MCLAGMKRQYGAGAESDESEEDDDVEWYRQEVGEEPDPGNYTISEYDVVYQLYIDTV